MRNLILLFFMILPAWANAFVVDGRIIDAETGKGIANVAIRWIKDPSATVSDAEGNFSIHLSEVEGDSVEFSHVAYKSKRMPTAKIMRDNVVLLQPKSIYMRAFVVTATRQEQDLMKIPQKVSLIDSAVLHVLPLHSIDDALIYSSGVLIDRPLGIFAAKSVVTMRGLSGNEQGRTLVLLDGVPINKSDGGTVNFNLVDPVMVDRIEVVKGPGSALYGGNAMGGVVNIITSIPHEKLSGRVKIGYGTYNTMMGDAGVKGFSGKTPSRGFFWSANALWRSSDGYISEPDYQRTEYTVPVFVQENIFSIKTGYKFSDDSHIWISGLYYDDERGGGEKVYEELGSYTEHDSYHLRGGYVNDYKGWNTTATMYFLCENYSKVNEYVKNGEYTLYDVDSKRSDMGLVAYTRKALSENNNLTAGFDVRQGAVDAADVYHTSSDRIINAGVMNNFALFAQDDISFGYDNWKIIAGLRFDYAGFSHGQFSVENPCAANLYLLSYEDDTMETKNWLSLSPKVAIQYGIDIRTKIYASYSHGFRAPILDDLCRSGKTRGGFQVANSNLVPETIESFELGARKLLKDKWVIEPSVYFSIGNDFMYAVSTGDTVDMGYAAPVIINSNVSQVNILGAEADVSFSVNKNLRLFANYAYAHSVITRYTPKTQQLTDITGLYLSNVPDHLANIGIQYLYKKSAGISLNARYVGKRWANDTNTPDDKYGLPAQYDDYVTADARIWKNIGKYWLLGLSVTNLGNQLYTDGKGQISPGRLFLIEAGMKF